jgi:uncharacterized ParB-like nuclease family protein
MRSATRAAQADPAGDRRRAFPFRIALPRDTLPGDMKPVVINIADIYIPLALRVPVDPGKVQTLAESIAELGQQTPVLVRPDKERYVLVSGLHRLEACKALGETTIIANLVQARQR